jgi:hypothetical protein
MNMSITWIALQVQFCQCDFQVDAIEGSDVELGTSIQEIPINEKVAVDWESGWMMGFCYSLPISHS